MFLNESILCISCQPMVINDGKQGMVNHVSPLCPGDSKSDLGNMTFVVTVDQSLE
jgi:hypothetical protein